MMSLQYYYEQMRLTETGLGLGRSKSNQYFYKNFIHFCEENSYTEITRTVIDKWILTYPYKTNKSKSRHISLIKNLSKFIVYSGGNSFIPDEEYKFREERYTPVILSNFQISEIFRIIDKENNLTFSVLFRLMYCCGLRPGEVIRLKRSQVNLITGDLYVIESKYNKDRHIIANKDIIELCKSYDLHEGEREYFFSINGKNIPSKYLSAKLHSLIKKYNLEFAKGFRPYDFRHNFATQNIMNWLEKGLDIMTMLPYLSTYMGHKKFSYTYYYIHLLPERLLQSKNVDWDSLRKIYADEALHGKN